MDELSSAPNTPIDMPDESHEIFLGFDTIKPDFTPLVDSGFLVEDTQEGIQLSPLAAYLLNTNFRINTYGNMLPPKSKQKIVTENMSKLKAKLPADWIVELPDNKSKLATIPDKSIGVRDGVYTTIFYHPEVADVAKQIYSNFYYYNKLKRPPMAMARGLTSAAMIGTLLSTGSALQSGNPLLVACAGAIGAVGGFTTSKLLPNTKRQLATRKNFNDPEWLKTQIETFEQILSDNSIAIESNPDMPDDPSCSLSRSANFWKDLPVPVIDTRKLLKVVAELEPLNADILWEFLEKRRSAEMMYRTLNNTLDNAETCHNMGIMGPKSLEEIREDINAKIAQIDTAYRQAWIDFTTERQHREGIETEEEKSKTMQREIEEFTNDWIAVVQQLETSEADVEKSGFGVIKEALFQGIKYIDKNNNSLTLTKDAIAFINRAQAAHNKYVTFQGIYKALYDQFGEDLNLMLPEEFMQKYPSIEANVL